MKLFTQYNRINLFATVTVFLLSGISYYFLLRYVLISQVDEDLKIEQQEIQTYSGKYSELPEIIAVKDQFIRYLPAAANGGKRFFSTGHVQEENEKELFRQVSFYIKVKEQWYHVMVGKSLEGTDNLIQSIISITLVTISVILIISFVVNRLLLKKLWQPFYDSIKIMRGFEIGKKEAPVFSSTSIEEFSIMNETFSQATLKAEKEYQYLKEFTENASHELQTPLAIIQSKLDTLIQDEQLSESQSRAAVSAYEAIQRLSRLNKGLLILTKIENGQYADTTPIDIGQKTKEKLAQFGEMIVAKNLQVVVDIPSPGSVKMNPVLADIMLNNLFSNAIKYNIQGGLIKVSTAGGRFEISNTGDHASLDADSIFRRFSKTGHAKEGVGLGLAIVRQAAEVSGYDTGYWYGDQQHHFVLTLKNTAP